MYERQHLPLRRIHQHRCGCSVGPPRGVAARESPGEASMQAFQFSKATTVDAAIGKGSPPGVKFVAGGTTLIDLMKLNVERPSTVIDINSLPLDRIEPTSEGGLKIGAMVRNSDLAHDPAVRQHYTVLSQALLSGASPQLRNMATTGGNLLQRTRCYYFR